MSKFQLILLIVFGLFVVIAVFLFSTNKGGSSAAAATVVVWGDIPAYDFNALLTSATAGLTSAAVKIQYVEKPTATFSADFTEALALGQGPDLVILPLSKLYKERNKLLLIPSSSVNPSDYASTFIEEGELFMTPQGTYALPLSVDPLVMYYNRDLFTNASLANPPKYWDEIYDYAQKLTQKDNAGNIKQSAIDLGEAKNIPNAKDTLSLLMLQAGTQVTSLSNGELRSELTNNYNLPLVPAEAALDFYTQFSNSAKPFYTWNRSLPPAATVFTSGALAMYIGYASELSLLKAKNPTLNLGVTSVPQSRVSGKLITFGKIRGVAVVKNTKNQPAAFAGALEIVASPVAAELSKISGLPPARRDLLSAKPSDLATTVFYNAAVQSKGFVDPDDAKTQNSFVNMIESVTSGRARVSEAVSTASSEIDSYVK